MFDEQHTHATIVGESADQAGEVRRLVLVEAGRRLVEEDGRWSRGHGSGDADQPAPAVGQLVRSHIEDVVELEGGHRGKRRARERVVPGPDQVHQPRPPRRGLSSCLQVLRHREVVEELERLEGSAKAAASRSAAPIRSSPVSVAMGDRANRGPDEPGDRIDERGLASAVRADEADDLARFHTEVDVLERRHRTEPNRDPSGHEVQRARPRAAFKSRRCRPRSRLDRTTAASHVQLLHHHVGHTVLVGEDDHPEK